MLFAIAIQLFLTGYKLHEASKTILALLISQLLKVKQLFFQTCYASFFLIQILSI